MTKLPRHINLSVEHQPHVLNYETVDQWLANGTADVEPEDHAAMLATGEVWVVHWYPDTPIGSCSVAAATLERALELANLEGE